VLQTSPAGQLPHWSRPPQPSLAAPQVRPIAAQVTLWQVSQTCDTASQTWPPVQVPQSSGFPQPSLAGPHWKPSEAQVCVTQGAQARPVPFGRHASPAGQTPQLVAWPHAFRTTPHVSPSCAHVLAGTKHCLLTGSQ